LPLFFLLVIPEGDLLLSLFVLRRYSERSEAPLYFRGERSDPIAPKINFKSCIIHTPKKQAIQKPPYPPNPPHVDRKITTTEHPNSPKPPVKPSLHPAPKYPPIEIETNWMYHQNCNEFVPSFARAVTAPVN
jgi:hypothetical protein